MANLVIAALEHVWKILSGFGMPMAVVGGLALAAWNRPRSTLDVDLLLTIPDDEVDTVSDALLSAGLKKRHPEPFRDLGTLRIMEFTYEAEDTFVPIRIDVLFSGADYYREALSRRVPHTLAGTGTQMDVLSCEDLIIHKLSAARPIDRADAVALLEENRAALDIAYLQDWTSRLNLSEEFADAWQTAFPDAKEG